MRLFMALVLLAATTFAYAEQPPSLDAVPEPPDLPMPVQSGEAIEPEPDIIIIKRGDKTIEEYRVNGELYKVKITPSVGPSYYLIDTNGDGNLDVREMAHDNELKTNQWILFEW